jgi:zinc/manganese transport system substrate-binding protein/manganese/iron transport system substrate-binding protein
VRFSGADLLLKDEAEMKVTRQRMNFALLNFRHARLRARGYLGVLFAALLLVTLAACSDGAPSTTTEASAAVTASDEAATTTEVPQTADPGAAEVLPALEPLTLAEGEKLRVVATTNLVAEVARRVGGEAIELTTLMPLGSDPHTYTPTPEDMRALNDAHVILINGLGLEEALMSTLTELDNPVPVVSVNAGTAPLTYGQATEEGTVATEGQAEAEAATQMHLLDPHTWLSVTNVMVWVDNVVASFAMLDTLNVDDYLSNAGAFQEELTALDAELRAQIDTLPAERRKLVSDHQEFNYFAQDYGFEIVGAVIPGLSTMAEPSAQELAALQDTITAAGVDTIFVADNVDDSAVNQLATDLGLEVVKLYTSSLSEADGPAPDYPTLMRALVNSIVTALAE